MKALCVAMLLCCLACGGATAQSESEFQPVEITMPAPTEVRAAPEPIGPSADGTIVIHPGLDPDPVTLIGEVVQGGTASTNPDCVGLFPAQPNQIIVVSEPMANVRIVVNGGSHDATLRILGPDDREHCNDDVDQLDPAVTLSRAVGRYQVWVGTYTEDAFEYTLGVSASPNLMPSGISGPSGSPPAAPVDMGSTSTFGTISLRPAFTPDPHVIQAIAGVAEGQESHEAYRWSAVCGGIVTPAPNHLFIAEHDFADLAIMARSPGDATLVIQQPDGSFLCNDDFEGLDPLVRGPMPQGTYKIWVGTFGGTAPYTLGISESSATLPSTLP